MIVRLLGPVEVVGPRGPAVLSGRQRTVVGLLALRVGTVVAPGQAVDALWGDHPPRTAVKSLQSHVARVRRALADCGLADVLLTRGSGYLLSLARDEVDVCRFEDQVRAGRAELAGERWDAGTERLRDALELWTGDPVEDSELAGWGRAEAVRLQEIRLTALEELWDAELRLGRWAEAASELERLLVRHPIRERLVELLMLALYRIGRPLDALEAYQRFRARLAHELGVDPAPRLRRVHTAILRHDPRLYPVAGSPGPGSVPGARPAPPRHLSPPVAATTAGPAVAGPAVAGPAVAGPWSSRPAQLPARVGHFIGRAAELGSLERLLDQDIDTRVAVVSGPGGIGKTALVVQWAHRVRHRFPDGQLFLDLRGHDPAAAMPPAQALAHVLRSLGVPGEQIPAGLSESTSLFRSLLDDKRVLIVLDNAVTVDQVCPLVPPAAFSALVVTSRRAMTSLSTYHAVRVIRLDALDDDDALALLCSVVGQDRILREPDDAVRIVASCGRLPLALRIAAAKLLGRPGRTLRALAVELTGEDRLDALRVEGDTRSVRAVLASAYRALSPPAARLFRLLGLHSGATFARHLAAAVADLSLSAGDRALAELTDAYLVADAGGGRFRLHDLIQLYAGECAHREEDPAARAETVDRLLDWYLGIAEAANRTLDRGRDRIVPALRHPLPVVPFAADRRATLAFLDAERENLLPVVRFAAEQGRHAAAWQLTYLLTGFFDSRGRWADRVEICRVGLAAAQRLGDPVAQGLMSSGLGVALVMTRRYQEALDCLHPALEIARARGDRRREGHVANNIATAYAGMRRFDEALTAYRRALAAHEANGDRLGVALACNNIGTAYVRLGRPELSFAHLDRALRLSRQVDNPRIEAGILSSLGEAYLRQGCPERALVHFRQALDIQRAIGDRRHEVDTLNHMGLACLARDDPDAAGHFHAAVRLSYDLSDQHLASVSLTHLATAHAARDDLDGARECLRRALALRTNAPDPYQEAIIHRALSDLARRGAERTVAGEHRERAIVLFLEANAPAEAAQLAPHPV